MSKIISSMLMMIKNNMLSFIHFLLVLIVINLFSTDEYEWMVASGDVDSLCSLPLGGRDGEEVFLIIVIPFILSLFFTKNKKIRYLYLSVATLYLFWSFYWRFQWC